MRKQITQFGMLVIAIIAASTSFFAQSANAQQMKTCNQYVCGIVEPGTGLITIRLNPGLNTSPILSFPQKSFFTVMIGDRIFTNNNVGTNVGNDPRFAGLLQNGVNQKIADTVRTTWSNINGTDVIQDVYPVTMEASGQIVIKWKVRNKSTNTPVWAQCQFLLDLQVGDQNPNDGAPILTRYGYRPIWESYNGASLYGIPWYFAAFENILPNPPSFNPGITGVGYTHDVNYKLGLKKPSQMTVGDWGSPLGNALVDPLWGLPGSIQWGSPYKDAAILLQWDGVGIGGNGTAEIARTSYGTGEFGICTGQLFGIVFYPRKFKWNATKYEPDTANIEFYAFNVYSPLPSDPNYGPASSGTYLKIHTGPNLTIIDPAGNPKVQRQRTSPADGYIPPYGVGAAFWKIKAEKAINCNTQLDSWLKFTAESSLGGTGPIFFNSGDADTCEHPVKIECVEEDFIAPYVKNEVTGSVFPYQKTFEVADDRPKDRGIKQITWVATPGSGTNVSNFTIEIPTIASCPKTLPGPIKITQKDSTIGGCFDFTILDCIGNDTLHSVCLRARPVKAVPDTLDPIITTVERTPGYPGAAPCNGRCDSLLFTDNQQYDVGLESVSVMGGAINMQLFALNVPFGVKTHRGKVCVIDSMLDGSITIRVQDTVGNYTDSTYRYCTVKDTTLPTVEIKEIGNGRGHWRVIVTDTIPWDRGVDSVFITSLNNVVINPSGHPPGVPPEAIPACAPFIVFDVDIIDSTKNASFCLKALDCAGNMTKEFCANVDADPDLLCPNIERTPPPGPNVTRITVSINDYHTNTQGDTLGWDKGIDEIWFTGVRGILVPAPMKIGCQMTAPPFTLIVEDTLEVDSLACVRIHAVDCAGNECIMDWCYPYNPDDLPPFLRVGYTSRTQLNYYVADTQLYDRGLQQVTLKNEVNFSPVDLYLNRVSTSGNTINRANYSTSSFGTLEAVDYWGTLNVSPAVKAAHTASVDLGVWVQDLQMKKGEIVRTSGVVELPVRFVRNDTFNLARKGIDEFEFTFTLSGDVGSLANPRVRTMGATTGWTVNTTANGNTYTVHGTKPTGGNSLYEIGGDTLLVLQFDATSDEFTKDVILSIDQVNSETIIYNNGSDRIVTGKNAIATLPAPYGTLTGSHIVIVGTCAPSMETSGQPPSIVTLEQNKPNPFNGSTSFSFTVKEDGMVKLAIYDMLGNEMGSVVNAILARGRYTVSFDGSKYSSGSYIARLQANGTVRSRTMRIGR